MRTQRPSNLVYAVAATVCFLSLAGIVSGQACQTNDTHADYVVITVSCTVENITDGCQVTKICKTGFSMIPGVGAQNLTCNAATENWSEVEESCKAQRCQTSDIDADYVVINDWCTVENITDGCQVHKTCKNGFSIISGGGAQILTCNGTTENWSEDEEPCKECTYPNYGQNCLERAGNCSSICPYNTTHGCARSDGAASWAVCDLNLLVLNISENLLSGTLGLTTEETLKIIAQVNVPDDDVTVKAIFNGDVTKLDTTGNGIYVHMVPVNLSSGGRYLISADTSVSSREENVVVAIYDPAKIERVYNDYNEEVVTKSSTVQVVEGTNGTWTCEATGVEPPEVWWFFGGVRISEIQLQNRLYQVRQNSSSTLYIHSGEDLQSEDSGTYTCVATNGAGGNTYSDMLAMNLLVDAAEEVQPIVEYTERTHFVIAVSVLGAVLLLTIITFAGIISCLRKEIGDYTAPRNGSPAPGNRANDYTPTPKRASKDFTDIRETSPDQAESLSTRIHKRPAASLPKNQQVPRSTMPPEPGPKPADPQLPTLPGMSIHRPGRGQNAQATPAVYHSPNMHHNPAFQHDAVAPRPEPGRGQRPQSPPAVYHAPNTHHNPAFQQGTRDPHPEKRHDEPQPDLPKRNQQGHQHDSQPIYDEPDADRDEGLYEETIN